MTFKHFEALKAVTGDIIRIDRISCPEPEHIWDVWRPDGYYPLEGPATPG